MLQSKELKKKPITNAQLLDLVTGVETRVFESIFENGNDALENYQLDEEDKVQLKKSLDTVFQVLPETYSLFNPNNTSKHSLHLRANLMTLMAASLAIGTLAFRTKSTITLLKRFEAIGRKSIPKAGRDAQKKAQFKKRVEIEAAIRSMGTFAKSNAFAKLAAIVVFEKTGYNIPWQTIKSSYLLKMDRQEMKGAA